MNNKVQVPTAQLARKSKRGTYVIPHYESNDLSQFQAPRVRTPNMTSFTCINEYRRLYFALMSTHYGSFKAIVWSLLIFLSSIIIGVCGRTRIILLVAYACQPTNAHDESN